MAKKSTATSSSNITKITGNKKMFADFDKAAALSNTINSTVAKLDALNKQRATWESTDFKKANDGLYRLLAECLDIYCTQFKDAEPTVRKELRQALAANLKAAGVKVQKNTNAMTMIIRSVFSSDRKRAHGYSYVLIAAISHEVSPADLPNFIINAGGIEEIKRKMVKSEEAIARSEKVQSITSEVAESIDLAIINPLAEISMPQVIGEYAVLIGKPSSNGMVSIVGVLSEANEAIVKALIQKIAKQQIAAQAAAAVALEASTQENDMLAHAAKINLNTAEAANKVTFAAAA